MNAQQIKALEATQRANETRDQNDAAIIADLLDAERETLTELLVHVSEVGTEDGPAEHPAAVDAIVRAGLVESIETAAETVIWFTPRGRRIARMLAA